MVALSGIRPNARRRIDRRRDAAELPNRASRRAPNARTADVDLATLLQHLRNGPARVLVERRDGVRGSRSSRPGTLDPKQCLLAPWAKREL